VPLGSVADTSFADVMLAKLDHTRNRELVCKTCNLDPLNKLVETLRARDAYEPDAPDVDQMIEKLRGFSEFAFDEIQALTGQPAPPPGNGAPKRRTIPITAV
jgi:hypothetical protein